MHALRIAHPKMTLLVGKPLMQILKSVFVESCKRKTSAQVSWIVYSITEGYQKNHGRCLSEQHVPKPDSLPNSLGNTRVLHPLWDLRVIAGSRTYFIHFYSIIYDIHGTSI